MTVYSGDRRKDCEEDFAKLAKLHGIKSNAGTMGTKFLCLCISEGQDEGCQGTTAAKVHKHLHSIILSEKKKTLDTKVCTEKGGSKSI